MAKASATATPKKRVVRRAPRKRKEKSVGLEPQDCRLDGSGELAALSDRIAGEGGMVLACYREPLHGHGVIMAVLPVDRVAPTPFQRDASDAHLRRLSEVIDRTGRFLDPVIAITAPERGFWTPNGRHRLDAMRRLGAKAITALVVPDREVAWQILALNTEKAHNLRERALEVLRIYRGLLEEDAARPESDFTLYLEDPALVTLGLCYEQKPKFAGGAYHPVLRRVLEFSGDPLREAMRRHEKLGALVQELEEKVAEAVARLKERGFQSPYLRAFVVARINPLRWIKGEPPPAEELLRTMRDRAARFNADKVKQQDLMGVSGAPDEES